MTSNLLLINSVIKNDFGGTNQLLRVEITNGVTTINYYVSVTFIKNCTSAILSSTGVQIYYTMDLLGASNLLISPAITFSTTDLSCNYTITNNFSG